jgi:hypothetical protein
MTSENLVALQISEWPKLGLALVAFAVADDGRRVRAESFNWVDRVVDAEIPAPTAKIDAKVAQGLMDDLWNAGIRPT